MNHEKMSDFEALIHKDYGNIAAIVVLKEGQMLYENYWNECSASSRLHLFSVTKSVVSILIGIALDKGYIKNIDQKVLDFFPDYKVKKREHTIANITLKNLLTMTAPYKYKSNPYTKYFTSNDFVTFSLDLLGGKGEIGAFRYAPLIGPDILSGILVKATGQSVFDFATEHLFSPLGITVEQNVVFHSKEEQLAFYKASDISGWVADPIGTNTAGWGLTLSPEDMAKLGQLYVEGGSWKGQQIVSKEWIDESTREHSCLEALNLPYGYLWWIHDCGFAAMGDGGNVIYVNTKNQIVIAIASFFQPKVNDRMALIKEHLEPLFA